MAAQAASDDRREALDERALAILDFEQRWEDGAAGKAEAIRDAFGVSPTRYYQQLGAVLRSEAALRHDPMLVGRLVRLRERRRQERDARREPQR